VLPGVGPALTVAMLLPLTVKLDPTGALIMFAGIYYGAMYGGSTTTILLNTPGESASIATALEGNRMAAQLAVSGTVTIRAVCVDQASGKLLHDVELFTIENPQPIHKLNSFASPSPVLAGGRLSCHCGDFGAACIDAASARHGLQPLIPLHALVETHGALREVQALAAHPRIESLSFGLMDFVSAHRGAIPLSAMSAAGQFDHPLVARAKLEIAAACHAQGKTPSHCVVTEFKDLQALEASVQTAKDLLGYTRMWSIHPGQVRTIVEAFAPTAAETEQAGEILLAAQAAQGAPIRHQDTLHDRASYRYFWHVLERAHRTASGGGTTLPAEVRQAFFGTPQP
jgi:hypothetical protein